MKSAAPARRARCLPWLVLGMLGGLALASANAAAQERATDGLMVQAVEIQGLEAISEAYVRRVIKTRPNQPFAIRQVEQDVRELLRTRKFLAAFADSRVADGQAIVIFTVQEKPTLLSVEIEGNKKFKDNQLYEFTPVPGGVLDVYALRQARDDMLQKYRQAGYYYVDITLDEPLLQSEGRALYRVVEGPRVRVRNIRFEGARSFGTARLRTHVESRTYFWLFRTGAFDEDQADRDALALQKFYRDEGFLDARVAYRLEFDPIRRADLDLIFIIEEGPRYRVDEIVIDGNEVFDDERIHSVLAFAPGAFVRDETLRLDVGRIQDLYGEIGFVDARIDTRYDYLETPGVVRLNFFIDEGMQSRFGRITIRGNTKTRDEVLRRELRFYPGELYNTVETRRAEQRLRETGLFRADSVEIVPLEDIDGEREVLVQVEEGEHVRFLIGFGVSTDNGVIGSLSIENSNFDIADWPRSWGEFFRGQSLRGAGQRLVFQAEPGTEVSRFRIAFTEPFLLRRPIRFDTSVYLFQRGRDGYDEQRIGFTFSLSKRFSGGVLDGWAIEGAARFENVWIEDLEPLVADDIYEARGTHFLTAAKAALVRDTTDSRLLPSEGYRLSLSWEQVGALGGEHAFGKPAVGFAWYKTVRTDVLDRKSIIALRADSGYIVGDAPVFERYYGGGFGSIRGFAFRGVSPRGGIFDDPIGGQFILLAGGEYSFPLYGRTFRGVTFMDMGTVEDGFTITTWRASVGFGLRVQVDFFGPVPIVFDFGFPIAKDEDDDTQVFNFAFGAAF